MRYVTLISFITLLASMGRLADAQNRRPHIKPRTELFRQTDLQKTWKTAVARRKPMLVMFTSDHCMYCNKMLAATYDHPAVQRMLAGRTETVLAHADDYRNLTKKLGIRSYPTSMLVSPDGEVLEFLEGYVDAKSFAQRVGPILARRPSQSLASAAVAPETSER
ncbi:MAG: thioredoxin family protein [Pirellulales bacterium]|nr:thioredoxin family protein [Pirellulales bacterium]